MFGVGAFVTQRNSAVARLLTGRLRLLGLQWVREEFTASRLHAGTHARYYWGPYDRIVDQERRAGLHVFGLLDYSNTWGYPDHGTMPHADIARLSRDFAAFAYAVARHFRGRVSYWQVWNEPDLQTFWHPTPDPDDYAALLSAAYRAIKRADRHAHVVLAGTSRIDLVFLRRVASRTQSFDVVSVHPYRNVPEPQLLSEIQALRALGKPLWFSEIGWAAGGCDLCTGEDTQASYLVRIYALAAAAGVQRVFWYDLRDDNNLASSPESHFGLLRSDLSAKPAFVAYEFLTRVMHRAFFRAAHTVDRSGVYALRFDTDHGPIEVLWNAGWSPQTVSIPWTGATAVIVQMDGTVIGEADVRYHHAIWLLPADGKPVYLVVRSPTPRLLAPGPLLHPPPPPPPRRPPPTRKSGRPPRRARVPIARRRAPPNRGAWAAPSTISRPGGRPRRSKRPSEGRLPTPTPTATSNEFAPLPTATPSPAQASPTFVAPQPSPTPGT